MKYGVCSSAIPVIPLRLPLRYYFKFTFMEQCIARCVFYITNEMQLIQGKHKVFHWLQIFITRKLTGHVGTLCCTSVRRVSAVDNFPTRWCTSTLGFRCLSVFGCNISKQVDWERCSDTLAIMTSFHGGMLRAKCFWHQFQILQMGRQEITDAFATITEDMLENTWRETDYRLDVLRATKGAHVEVY